MSLVGALTKALKAGETAKKTAPFYSAVDEALANLKRPKGTGAEFFTELSKQAGVKKAELADRKLEQAFKSKGKITKEEAQKILKENPPPKLQEREYNEKMVREEEDIKEELAQQMYGRSYEDLSHRDRRPIFDETQRIMGEENGPQYGDYKTQGGENYREILLKLPTSRPNAANYSDPAKYDADLRAFNASGKKDYQSSHWKEDPNVLAHMRVQDRTGPNGEKILHVEEIQSDWHQEGRKKGYEVRPTQEELDKIAEFERKSANNSISMSERAQWAGLINKREGVVPDAPFKKNWHELAMKRLLNYAADNGYDSIAITPGAEQAKRYSLSKQIDALEWDERTGRLYAKPKDRGDFNKMADGVTSENLSDYVGKEVAEKLMSQPSTGTNRILGGVDLEVGGEGMKGFYDQILPSYLNTFGKPYGAQVDVFNMPNPRKGLSITDVQKEAGITEQQWLDLPSDEKMRLIDDMDAKAKAATMPLHSFTITPEMRQQIQQKGLPLYQQIGIPTAGAGAASQMPEQMQEPELEPEVKKADGGAINYNTAPDMSDGGRIIQGAPFKRGGKVNISTNRDAMFMELSNKKLKRK